MRPYSVKTQLEKGSLVEKSSGLAYEIDDPEIIRELAGNQTGKIAMGPVYRALKPSRDGIWNMFHSDGVTIRDGKRVIPYSRAFRAGLGECSEKAIAIQLSAQASGMECHLINGSIGEDDDSLMFDPHAFNIIYDEKGGLFIVDAENPVRVNSDGTVCPYSPPITAIEPNGKIKVPSKWKIGRIYALF